MLQATEIKRKASMVGGKRKILKGCPKDQWWSKMRAEQMACGYMWAHMHAASMQVWLAWVRCCIQKSGTKWVCQSWVHAHFLMVANTLEVGSQAILVTEQWTRRKVRQHETAAQTEEQADKPSRLLLARLVLTLPSASLSCSTDYRSVSPTNSKSLKIPRHTGGSQYKLANEQRNEKPSKKKKNFISYI